MATTRLGRTLIIANPTAHSGKGAQGADFVRRFLDGYASLTNGYEMRLTSGPGDGTDAARAAKGFDTVVALGGDGIIHEVVNGLMDIDAPLRPTLGIIPMGSGNDFARTLGVIANDPGKSLGQLAGGSRRRIELGLVNGVHYMETLSFGLDAAVALDTTTRRAAGTSQEGTGLFVSSCLKIFSSGKDGWHFHATFDDERDVEGTEVVFAVQVGPTYGAGFRVCPDANPTDGLLDVCYTKLAPSVPHTLALLARARAGKHVGSKVIQMTQARHVVVDFDVEPPCQVDGEKLVGRHFDITVEPEALEVIVPAECGW